MKFFIALIMAIGLGQASYATCLNPQSNQEMVRCAGKDLQVSNAKVNGLFKQLKARAKNDPKYLKIVEQARASFLAFKKAQIKLKYAHIDGSITSYCMANYERELTNDFIKTLKNILNPVEGDTCYARIPLK